MGELREVLSGSEPDGVEWTILGGNDDGASSRTFVRRSQRGGPVAQSGMGGPKLHADAPVNVWTGQADGTPPFVLLRTAPTVESAVVITDSGTHRELTLSSVVNRVWAAICRRTAARGW